MEKKLKIFSLILVSLFIIGMITTIGILLKKNRHLKNDLILEKNLNSRNDILMDHIEKEKNEAKREADEYKLKFENHEKKLDSIYNVALNEHDDAVLEFFANKQWRRFNPDR